MLVEKELNTTKASCPWFAARDAQRYDQECASRYTSQQRAKAQTVADLLDLAYSGKIYITHRKTFVAVKVDKPTVRNRKLVADVDAIFEENGYEKITTPQGITVRLFKK